MKTLAQHTEEQRRVNIAGPQKRGIRGVSWNSRRAKWFASITVNGITYHAGLSADLLEATCHRLAGEQSLNWAGCDSLSPAYQYVKKHIPTIK